MLKKTIMACEENLRLATTPKNVIESIKTLVNVMSKIYGITEEDIRFGKKEFLIYKKVFVLSLVYMHSDIGGIKSIACEFICRDRSSYYHYKRNRDYHINHMLKKVELFLEDEEVKMLLDKEITLKVGNLLLDLLPLFATRQQAVQFIKEKYVRS